MSVVYAADCFWNREFEIPWCKIGKSWHSGKERHKRGTIFCGYSSIDTQVKGGDTKLTAVEAVACLLAQKKYGSAPSGYTSRKDGKRYGYHGYTETFTCTKEQATELIQEALRIVENL
tara:strand:+ start:170 stop:523 length:354 start_codon:yes stop_codon:yes gene_type:complete